MTKKVKKNYHVINVKALREVIVKESRFITDLIDRLPIPVTAEGLLFWKHFLQKLA
jgi:hypothetical protein